MAGKQKRVVIYARVSTDEQTTANQIAELAARPSVLATRSCVCARIRVSAVRLQVGLLM